MLKDWALVSTFCHWGVEGGDFALKGELTPPLNTTHHEISHTSAHQLHSDLGLLVVILGGVHGQNTDSGGAGLSCPGSSVVAKRQDEKEMEDRDRSK